MAFKAQFATPASLEEGGGGLSLDADSFLGKDVLAKMKERKRSQTIDEGNEVRQPKGSRQITGARGRSSSLDLSQLGGSCGP